MKRLTQKHYGASDYFMACSENCAESVDCTACPSFDSLVDRLGAYENTGLTPESVEALKLSMMGKAVAEIKEFDGLPIDRLKELAEADKEGRVVVLPCKVGGEVYSTLDDLGRLHRCRVPYVSIGEKQHLNWAALDPVDYKGSHYGAPFSAFGKTVFRTREEAEEALRRAEDG